MSNAERGLMVDTAQEVGILKNEHACLLDLCKTLLQGHANVKKIIVDLQLAGLEHLAENSELSRHIGSLGDARSSTDEQLKSIKGGFADLDVAGLWEELFKELPRDGR